MQSKNTREIVIVTGAGAIGQAIARRVSAGRTILFADINGEAGERAASALRSVGFEAESTQVDVSSRESVKAMAAKAVELGSVTHLVHTAGLSPAQASPEAIVAVDLIGTANVLEEIGEVIAVGGSGVVISSQAGHMLPPLTQEQNQALGQTPAEDLAQLSFLQPSEVPNSGFAYALAKRANTLRVQAASVTWGDRGARLNSLSPGIIMTPLAQDELNGPGGRRLSGNDSHLISWASWYTGRSGSCGSVPPWPRRRVRHWLRSIDRWRCHCRDRNWALSLDPRRLARTGVLKPCERLLHRFKMRKLRPMPWPTSRQWR